MDLTTGRCLKFDIKLTQTCGSTAGTFSIMQFSFISSSDLRPFLTLRFGFRMTSEIESSLTWLYIELTNTISSVQIAGLKQRAGDVQNESVKFKSQTSP
jgi:hypothetical protein